jgi:hypothetical protein
MPFASLKREIWYDLSSRDARMEAQASIEMGLSACFSSSLSEPYV